MLGFCNIANAEWTPIAEGKNRSATFIDKTSIRKHGDYSEMWSTVVYLEPREVDGKRIMSFRELDEFDCKLKKSRIITLIGYTAKLATGSVVIADFDVGDWISIPIKSIAETQLNKACE